MADADHTPSILNPGTLKDLPPLIPRACEACGMSFLTKRDQVIRGLGRFCSRKCWGKSLNKPRIARTCEQCGGSFEILPSRATEAGRSSRFCSWDCYKAAKLESREPIAVRFWSRVRKTDSCWLWTGPRIPKGYGQLGRGGKRGKPVYAHRLSWEIHRGPIPDGMQVLHECDNPPCVNPNHLFLGTHTDNMADMVAKGRRVTPSRKGIRNAAAKLNPSLAAEIRTLNRSASMTRARIAERFGVSITTIGRVIRDEVWIDP